MKEITIHTSPAYQIKAELQENSEFGTTLSLLTKQGNSDFESKLQMTLSKDELYNFADFILNN